MKLQNLVARLEKHHKKKIDLSLDRTFSLLKKLGNPQDKIKAISIVGTNGKQSTINAILKPAIKFTFCTKKIYFEIVFTFNYSNKSMKQVRQAMVPRIYNLKSFSFLSYLHKSLQSNI